MLRVVLAAAGACGVLLAACTPAPAHSTPAPRPISAGIPVRAAFFYPWFPESWTQQGIKPFTQFHPAGGYYDSADPTIIDGQIRQMEYGHIGIGIASWQGRGTPTDGRVGALLSQAIGHNFKWTLYYEAEGVGDPTSQQIQADLSYLAARYTMSTAYAQRKGKPVLFVYDAGDAKTCAKLARWHAAPAVASFYVVQKVFPGFADCPYQPDAWHQYAPASATERVPGFAYNVSPGFFKAGEAAPRLPRNIARFRDDVRKMNESQDPWQLVTTFNEWGEGTAVEPASEWTSASGYGAYLDALHAVAPR